MRLTKRLPHSRKSRSISNSVKSTQNNTTRFMKKYDIDNYDALLKNLQRILDVIGIFLPMIQEANFSILDCSKIGVVLCTLYSGYGSRALHSRLTDSNAGFLITTNKMKRKGKLIDQQQTWLKAVEESNVSKVI